MDLSEIVWDYVNWIHFAQKLELWRVIRNTEMNIGGIKNRKNLFTG
jgi:hypothetical protein